MSSSSNQKPGTSSATKKGNKGIPLPVDPNLMSSGKVGDWVRHVSASSGKEYYYNITTSTSKWQKPKEWIAFETENGLVPHRLVPFSALLEATDPKTSHNNIQPGTKGYKENLETTPILPDPKKHKDHTSEDKLGQERSGNDREEAIRQLYDQAARLGIKLPAIEQQQDVKRNKSLASSSHQMLEVSIPSDALDQTEKSIFSTTLKVETKCSDSRMSDRTEKELNSKSGSGPNTQQIKQERGGGKIVVESIDVNKKRSIDDKDNLTSKRSKKVHPILTENSCNNNNIQISLTRNTLKKDATSNKEKHPVQKNNKASSSKPKPSQSNPCPCPVGPIITRPHDLKDKSGFTGEPVTLVANYFPIRKTESDWELYHYTVDFNPSEPDAKSRKNLLAQHAGLFGTHIFDGWNLYSLSSLENYPIVLYAALEQNPTVIGDGSKVVEITVKSKMKIKSGDPYYHEFWSLFIHLAITNCLKLEHVGSNYFDFDEKLRQPVLGRLEICPGYTIELRDYESGLMMNIGFMHKVVQSENCLQILKSFKYEKDVNQAFVGTTVMTSRYNSRTYEVQKVDWDKNPLFKIQFRKGTSGSLVDYYKTKYGIEIKDLKQPIFVALSKDNPTADLVLLIPELCQSVGLPSHLKKDYKYTEELGNLVENSNLGKSSIQRLVGSMEFRQIMESWRLSLDTKHVTIPGRIVPEEQIVLRFDGQRVSLPVVHNLDWYPDFKDHQMLVTKSLRNWAVFVHKPDRQEVDFLLEVMRFVGKTLDFEILDPVVIQLPNERESTYLKTLEKTLRNNANLEMVLFVVTFHENHLYKALKKKVYVDYGIPSQCLLVKNLREKIGFHSAIGKLLIQINCKLGGEPWGCNNPLKVSHTMVAGYSESEINKQGSKIGALVATTNHNFSTYYSTSFTHHGRIEDNSELISEDLIKCIRAFQSKNNNILPDRIMLYRQTNGNQKELVYINTIEVKELKSKINCYYINSGCKLPLFSMILASKQPSARFIDATNSCNPTPGTVVDSVITLPEHYDFYLMSGNTKVNTMIPTYYNVIWDEQSLSPDHLQRLTFKLCHLYFNSTRSIHLPAMCQYAKRLAQLVVSLDYEHVKNENLKHTLFYL